MKTIKEMIERLECVKADSQLMIDDIELGSIAESWDVNDPDNWYGFIESVEPVIKYLKKLQKDKRK